MSQNDFFLFYGEGKVTAVTSVGCPEAAASSPNDTLASGASAGDDEVDHDAEVDSVSYKRIFGRSWTYILTGYVNFATSLCVFPAITTLGKYFLSLDRCHPTARWMQLLKRLEVM